MKVTSTLWEIQCSNKFNCFFLTLVQTGCKSSFIFSSCQNSNLIIKTKIKGQHLTYSLQTTQQSVLRCMCVHNLHILMIIQDTNSDSHMFCSYTCQCLEIFPPFQETRGMFVFAPRAKSMQLGGGHLTFWALAKCDGSL